MWRFHDQVGLSRGIRFIGIGGPEVEFEFNGWHRRHLKLWEKMKFTKSSSLMRSTFAVSPAAGVSDSISSGSAIIASPVFRLLPRRELELKSIKTGVLCTELVGGWGRKGEGGEEPEHRRFGRATQGGRFKRWTRINKLFPWSSFQ